MFNLLRCSAIHLKEVCDQREEVARAISKRWHVNRKNCQAVIQVGTKGMAAHQRIQISVSGGYDPGVYAKNLPAAQYLYFSILQKAQEFDLHIRGQFSDFIEENCASMGRLESSNPRMYGARERSLSEAKEL